MLFFSFLFAALWVSTFAQDLSVPKSWREADETRSQNQRVKIAKAALDSVKPHIDPTTAFSKDIGYWNTAATILSAMANFDHFTHGTTYKAFVTTTLNTASSKYSHFDKFNYNDDAMWWATASYYAYRAYGDTMLLNHAIDTWQHVSNFQIKSSGKVSGSKTVPIQAKCNGVSMSGGVFWRPTSNDKTVNSITTGLFMTLSSYLATSSNGAAQYKNAAVAAANWLKNANKDASKNLILDTLSADCSRSPASWMFTYNTGKYLEGLNVLAKATGSDSWKTEMTNVATAAMKHGPWQGANGIITEGKNDTRSDNGQFFKAVYVRALNEIHMSSSQGSTMGKLTHSYIDVQYNAILELAAKGSAYSTGWAGPGHEFTVWGQAVALDTLVSAITAS